MSKIKVRSSLFLESIVGYITNLFSLGKKVDNKTVKGIKKKDNTKKIPEQKELLKYYRMVVLKNNTASGFWTGSHIKCPLCKYYVYRGGYDKCTCGNISIDDDMLRVAIRKSKISDVKAYNAVWKNKADEKIRKRMERKYWIK